MNWFKII